MRARRTTLAKGPREFDAFSPLRIAVNRLNHRMASEHLGRHPQMAILSFDHIGLRINFEGRYEGRYLAMIERLLADLDLALGDRVALDIGANVGNHSLFFAEMFRRVYAFEPNPHVFELLKINGSFACRKGNVECRNLGLSNVDARLSLRVDRSNFGGGSVVADPAVARADDVGIEVRRLDSLEELKDEDIAFVKIDVEGHELQVLEGARETLARKRPIVSFEQHASEIVDGSSPAIDLLRSMNYRFATIERNLHLGERGVQKVASLILRVLFGTQLRVVERSHFDRRFYDLIIAIPNR